MPVDQDESEQANYLTRQTGSNCNEIATFLQEHGNVPMLS